MHPHSTPAEVAQPVEHATENRGVGGSRPPLGTLISAKIPVVSGHSRAATGIAFCSDGKRPEWTSSFAAPWRCIRGNRRLPPCIIAMQGPLHLPEPVESRVRLGCRAVVSEMRLPAAET
jgi:hypothetical protein